MINVFVLNEVMVSMPIIVHRTKRRELKIIELLIGLLVTPINH